MLIRWPVQYASYMQMSRLHVPPIFRLWQLPAPPWHPAPAPAPAPTSASINRRAYYTMQCVPGSMEESPLSIPHPSLCIPYREHAATFLASSRCVCICPTVRQTGLKTFYAAFVLLLRTAGARGRQKGRGTRVKRLKLYRVHPGESSVGLRSCALLRALPAKAFKLFTV